MGSGPTSGSWCHSADDSFDKETLRNHFFKLYTDTICRYTYTVQWTIVYSESRKSKGNIQANTRY